MGGTTPENIDSLDSVTDPAPVVIGFVLLLTFVLLRERPDVRASGVPIPDTASLKRYCESGLAMSNATLKAEVLRTGDPDLRYLLEWSLAVNEFIERTVKNVPPFRWVRESLERMSKSSDLIVVSQTPEEALVREWEEHGLDGYVAVIAGQELGTKGEHIAMATQGRYPPERILMVGDALGDLKDPSLKKFILSEEIGRTKGEEPPSIKAMQRLELVDYEEASDRGHFRMFPKGHLVFKLLEKWAEQIATDRIGAIQIDTPIMYDWSLPDIKSQGMSFHERHYTLKTEENREFVLRFAGDFGLFRMMKGATLSYRNLPLRIYEFSKSFRLEQRGELTRLKRLRAFHMPDVHCFTRNVDEGWKEYMLLYKSYVSER